MSEPKVRSSSNPTISGLYHKNAVFVPSSCGSALEEVASLKRQLVSLDEQLQKDLSENDMAGFASKAILSLTIVKETCMSFVSLAATLSSALGVNKKLAKSVKDASDFGMTFAERYTGQISNTEAANRMTSKAIDKGMGKLVPAGTEKPAVDAFKHASNAAHEAAKEVTRGGEGKSTFVKNVSFSLSATLVSTLEHAFNDTNDKGLATTMKVLGVAVEIGKEADVYSSSLEKAFDKYLDDKETWARLKSQIKAEHKRTTREMHKRLSESLKYLEQCAIEIEKPTSNLH